MEAAFQKGDPQQVWGVTQQLLELTRASVVEAAKARFQVHFGTERCDRCEGLRAGPGVVATCFQVRQCYFTNLREEGLTTKQARVLQLFFGEGS